VTSTFDRELSRRDLLRRGAGAALSIGAVSLLPASARAARGSRSARQATTTLKFARSVAPTQLDPANSIIAGDVYTLDKIFEPLYVTSPSGQLTPWLATGATVSKDGKTYTFALRPGVKFSDGSPLTANDVVFSINRARKNSKGPLSFLDGAITSLEAKGDSTVVAQLSAPWAPFLSDISVFANGILPTNFGGKSETDFFNNPVGTGPFVLAAPFQASASSLTLNRNPNYWQAGKPYLDTVEFLYVDDDNQRVLQLRGGQVDVIDSVPPADVSSLKAESGIAVGLYPAWEVDLLVMNEKLPQYADRNVRRAITQAINRPALVSASSFGTAKPGGSFFPPSLQYYAPENLLPYNLTAAKASLAKSKFPQGFKTTLLIDGGVQKWQTFAQIVQQQLKPLNIDVTIKALDHAAFESTFQKDDYDLFIDYAINDISDPDEMASFELDFKNGGSGSYWSSYNNPAVIKLVHQAETLPDGPKRAALYGKIQQLVAGDAPFVPLDYPPYIYASSTKVQGFAVNPGGAYRLENVKLAV
jgi:peptide/nickel transport system substrate-binding protein